MIILTDESVEHIYDVLEKVFKDRSTQVSVVVIPIIEQLRYQNNVEVSVTIDPESRRINVNFRVHHDGSNYAQIDISDSRGFTQTLLLNSSGEVVHAINDSEISSILLDAYCEEQISYYVTVGVSTPVYLEITYYGEGSYSISIRV